MLYCRQYPHRQAQRHRRGSAPRCPISAVRRLHQPNAARLRYRHRENGETLSGGERQRISIARALLKNAPIILLDEATASLDAENETKIQAGISELVRNKTVIIIAHRMRTVRNADHIVVLSGGTVSEQGTPDELLTRNGEFARMVRLQQEKRQ